MRDQIQARLGELKREYEKGQLELYKIEQQQAHLREMMLRISGAIQVLEELLTLSP
jgi:predicted nuclease with TOPRIM domain